MSKFVSDSLVSRCRFAALLGLLGLLGHVAGCGPGGDPNVAKARAVLEETISKNPEFERFAISNAAGTRSQELLSLIEAGIQSDNFQTSIDAIHALGEEPPHQAEEVLRSAFDKKSGAVKLAAAIELARLGDDAAMAYLKSQIADPQQVLDVTVVKLVANTQDGKAFLEPLLKERLKSDDPGVRDEVYAALGEIGQPWATGMLVQGFRKEHGEDRQEAIAALGNTHDPVVASVISPFVNTQGLVFVTLSALGELGNPEAADAVRKMLDNPEGAVRAYAAVALWRMGEKDEAMPVVNKLVQEPDATVRQILAQQLGPVGDAEAASRLATLAEDESMEVRVEALRAIALHPDLGYQEVLLKAANDPEYEVSTLALNLLGQVGKADAIESIAPLMDSDNPYVAIAAAEAVLSIRARQPAGGGS